ILDLTEIWGDLERSFIWQSYVLSLFAYLRAYAPNSKQRVLSITHLALVQRSHKGSPLLPFEAHRRPRHPCVASSATLQKINNQHASTQVFPLSSNQLCNALAKNVRRY